VALVCIAGVLRMNTYLWRFHDRLSLYETAVAEQPDSVRLKMLLAFELNERGQRAEAAAVLEKAMLQLPDYAETRVQAGIVAFERGLYADAERLFQEAEQIEPRKSLKVARYREKMPAMTPTTHPADDRP
jgi:tetratricopeptide (TPR) repeat protein